MKKAPEARKGEIAPYPPRGEMKEKVADLITAIETPSAVENHAYRQAGLTAVIRNNIYNK